MDSVGHHFARFWIILEIVTPLNLSELFPSVIYASHKNQETNKKNQSQKAY